MTPRRTATDLRTLAALLDNTRAVAGLEALVEIALSHEFAMRFAGACEEAADTLDPLDLTPHPEEDAQARAERLHQALGHIEWAARSVSGVAADWEKWFQGVAGVAREALGR